MLAVVAVDFMCRERRGAAVQCGGKNRDGYFVDMTAFRPISLHYFILITFLRHTVSHVVVCVGVLVTTGSL